MRPLLLFSCFLLLVSCKSKQLTANSPEKYDLEVLAEVISQDNLNDIYPSSNMTEGTELFEEGTVEHPYTILYPKTPDQILIIWKDDERTKLHQIYIDKESRWRSNTGIRIGSTYDELVEINGGPIKFYGFGWDHSGAVDWNMGGLAKSNIRVFLAPLIAPPKAFYTDQMINTTQDEIDNMKLRVRAILFQAPGAD